MTSVCTHLYRFNNNGRFSGEITIQNSTLGDQNESG